MIAILLGSNIGDRFLALEKAKLLIRERVNNQIIESSVFESEPWGFQDEINFLNQVICVETKLPPHDLLEELLAIEKEMGRMRSRSGYQSRVIDLDILLYNDLIVSDDKLKIPHPRLHERRFTLEPLNELLPDFIHPVLGRTVNELLNDCQDKLIVKKL
ncbi:MAG: 2-amino-4-hydroxy-6-hydroxymethyldihydropteridine diphosphokinase [Bacteroidales bacterium]|nr:2-amino-4-hydroxy-6-hydroxymethyldihydropteridine diphosphokinase [Bacteroidales bacterium]